MHQVVDIGCSTKK